MEEQKLVFQLECDLSKEFYVGRGSEKSEVSSRYENYTTLPLQRQGASTLTSSGHRYIIGRRLCRTTMELK